MNPLDLPGPSFLLLYAAVLVAAILAVVAVRRSFRRGPAFPATASRPMRLDAYELAYLASGPARAVQAAVVALAHRGAVAIEGGSKLKVVGPTVRPADPLEAAVHQAVRESPGRFARIVPKCQSATRAVEDRLVGAGLFVPQASRSMASWVAVGVMLAVAAFGLAKIYVGLGRHKPVAFLVIAVAAAFVAMLVFVINQLRRTVAGDAVLADWQQRNSELQSQSAARVGDQLPLAVALFGPVLLAGTPLAEFQRPLHYQGTGGDGGSSGSSCGGSDGGGGGGGCGGCGGGGD